MMRTKPDDSRHVLASEVVLALLRERLGTGSMIDPEMLRRCDWPRFESLVTHHGLAPVTYEVLDQHSASMPPALLQRMRSQVQSAALRNRVACEMIDDVGAVFAAAQIPGLLLRGTPLLRSLHSDGGTPILRGVDLLVAEGYRGAAERHLGMIGFLVEGATTDVERASANQSHAILSRPGQASIPLIIHGRLFEPPGHHLFAADAVFARALPADRMPGILRAMSLEHELIYLCLLLDPGSRRPSSSHPRVGKDSRLTTRWRELYDLGDYLQQARSEIRWDDVLIEARGRDVAGQVLAALELCGQALSVAPPEKFIRSLAAGVQRRDRAVDLGEASAPNPLARTADRAPLGLEPSGCEDEPTTSPESGSELTPASAMVREIAQSCLEQRPGLRLNDLRDGLVEVYDRSGHHAIRVNVSAAAILQLCNGSRSVAEITADVARLFEIDAARISEEVRQTVQTLQKHGMLRFGNQERRPEYSVVDRHRRWSARPGNRFQDSRYVDWRHIREGPKPGVEHDILFFTQFDVEDAHLYTARKKVAWIREPRPIAWWSYDALEAHIEEVDTVLTYDMDLIRKYPDKCIYCPSGGCHINPDDFQIYPKRKLVSFIASAKRWKAPGHLARHEFCEIYGPPSRAGFTKNMLGDLQVDRYGTLAGNPIPYKLDSLKDYMFQIAIENIILDTYFTEKLLDCFLTGTIPIYRGSRRVGEFFDADGILFYSSTEELFGILQRLTPVEYERRLPHARRNYELAHRYTHAVDWVYEHTDVFRS